MLLRKLLTLSFLAIAVLSKAQNEDDSLTHKTFYYESGAKSSEGYMRNGQPDGYWKSYYRDGTLKTEGNRTKNKLDSIWKFYDRQGNLTMEIEYDMGQKDGWRKAYKNGNLIKKQPFVNDTLQGYSKHFYPGGSLEKEIPYKNGKARGDGYVYSKDGRIITLLTYKDGNLTKKQPVNRKDKANQKQGLWMAFYDNRQVKKEGPYRNNLKNGYWKYYKRNGDLIRVEKWVNGELQEDATETAKVEIKREIDPETGELAFKGSYRNGKPEGVHRKYDKKGNVESSKIYENGKILYEGIIDKQGLKQGPWKIYYPSGKSSGKLRAEGSYKDDRKVGEWKYYFRNGDLEQIGSYLLGEPDGRWVWFYPDGDTLRRENYYNGQRDGFFIEYNDSGAVVARGQYINGYKDGEWFYRVNDHKEVGKYFEGERTGVWKHYYLSNGNLRFKGRYENGLKNGEHIFYYDNEQIKRRGKYLADKRNGLWEFFTKSGQRYFTIEYEEGKEVKYNGEKIDYGRRYRRAMAREREQN